MKTVLTIAGSDSSGGAGIQADIKTVTMHGLFAMSAITALTAQNTLGVRSIQETDPQILDDQISAVCEDIIPDAVKIGMIPSPAQVDVISGCIKRYRMRNIVLDPVMAATSGAALSRTETVQRMKTLLFPPSTLITPNIPEAEALTEMNIRDDADMERAAAMLHKQFGCAVLVKGGHRIQDANDVLYTESGSERFIGARVANDNTHGTGCTLSSAIAANLAKGLSLADAVRNAKEYLTAALTVQMKIGHGNGPVCHNFDIINRKDI